MMQKNETSSPPENLSESDVQPTDYLNELPIHLRIEVIMHVHREPLGKLAIFKQRSYYRDWFIANVANMLQPMVGYQGYQFLQFQNVLELRRAPRTHHFRSYLPNAVTLRHRSIYIPPTMIFRTQVVVAGDLVYQKGEKEPYNVYNVFAGAVEAIDPISDELVAVYQPGMLFGLEGAIDCRGSKRDKELGYPHTVVAQPLQIQGVDRGATELFVLTQELIQTLDENGSVYYHPLK